MDDRASRASERGRNLRVRLPRRQLRPRRHPARPPRRGKASDRVRGQEASLTIRKRWAVDETVRGFALSPPNDRLLHYAAAELTRCGGRGLALDVGCGAARNLAPLVASGWHALGIDTSRPMLEAAGARLGSATITSV